MRSRAKETTAEWISERLIATIGAYPKEAIAETMPIILMHLVREFGFASLEPQVRASVLRVMEKAGIRDGMSDELVAKKMRKYLDSLDVDEKLLFDVHEIFRTHHSALAESKRADFRELGGAKAAPLPQHVGARRVAGGLTPDQLTKHRRA